MGEIVVAEVMGGHGQVLCRVPVTEADGMRCIHVPQDALQDCTGLLAFDAEGQCVQAIVFEHAVSAGDLMRELIDKLRDAVPPQIG